MVVGTVFTAERPISETVGCSAAAKSSSACRFPVQEGAGKYETELQRHANAH
jgi:hypothetical protein